MSLASKARRRGAASTWDLTLNGLNMESPLYTFWICLETFNIRGAHGLVKRLINLMLNTCYCCPTMRVSSIGSETSKPYLELAQVAAVAAQHHSSSRIGCFGPPCSRMLDLPISIILSFIFNLFFHLSIRILCSCCSLILFSCLIGSFPSLEPLEVHLHI